jgi:hypothetical protein
MNHSEAIVSWLKRNYGILVTAIGGFALYKVVIFFNDNERLKNIEIIKSFTKFQQYPLLFNAILETESETYDDMNYYKGSALSSYVKGKYGKRYAGMSKDLTEYTIGEIIKMQGIGRDTTNGQLWAVGRYQVIPSTLSAIYKSAGLGLSDKFTAENQDKIGMALLKSTTKAYLNGSIPNTQANREKSALEIAQTWSSVGVPYPMQGRYERVQKNESFYKRSGGFDVANTKTEEIQRLLEQSRKK